MNSIQSFILDNRRQFNIRKHYDVEVERWISQLRKDVEDAESTSRLALGGRNKLQFD